MSKELFFEMRAEEIAYMYDENFSKKQAIQTGVALANKVLDDGLVDPLKVFSNVCRLKEVINAADKEFRDKLSIVEKRSENGVEFSSMAGRETPNYNEDAVFNALSEQLKQRQELLKSALKQKELIFDSEGCEVPRVTSSQSKSSITVKF